jgi:hypothetical protein
MNSGALCAASRNECAEAASALLDSAGKNAVSLAGAGAAADAKPNAELAGEAGL